MSDEHSPLSPPEQPRLRRVDSFPVSQPGGEVVFALRDPEGFSGSVVVPYTAAVLASLMDGTRTLADVRDAFRRQSGQTVELVEIEQLVRDLDERWFFDTPRFRDRWKGEFERFLNSPLRPAVHAGRAYPADAEALRKQLAALLGEVQERSAAPEGESARVAGRLAGVLCPHIDLARGGPALACGYARLVDQSEADVFVIFGTSHNPMRHLFCATRKHFETPLGTVQTDRKFVSSLAANLAAVPGGGEVNLFADELAHRQEHSIEFQAVFLQYLLAERRPFAIVPILTASFHEFVSRETSPSAAPEFSAFVAAMKKTAAELGNRVTYISAGDLAHIGQRYGDRAFLNAERLKQQAQSDRDLLVTLARADPEAFFERIAGEHDRHRICGLSPTYTMLKIAQPTRGELLKYDQAVELDGTSCVSFASMAFYDE